MKKIIIISITFLVSVGLLVFFGLKMIDNNPEIIEQIIPKEPLVLNEYRLDKYTLHQEDVFKAMITYFDEEEKTNQKTAEHIAHNFLIDFYDISLSKSNEINAIMYIYEPLKPRFLEFGGNLYNFYQYYDRKKLEIIESEITNTKKIAYDYIDDLKKVPTKRNLEAYEVTIKWQYKDNVENIHTVTVAFIDNQPYVFQVAK
jgi:hypothetical protein